MSRRTARLPRRGQSLVIDTNGRRRLTRSQKVGVASVATLAGVALLGVVAGLLLDRLLGGDYLPPRLLDEMKTPHLLGGPLPGRWPGIHPLGYLDEVTRSASRGIIVERDRVGTR